MLRNYIKKVSLFHLLGVALSLDPVRGDLKRGDDAAEKLTRDDVFLDLPRDDGEKLKRDDVMVLEDRRADWVTLDMPLRRGEMREGALGTVFGVFGSPGGGRLGEGRHTDEVGF